MLANKMSIAPTTFGELCIERASCHGKGVHKWLTDVTCPYRDSFNAIVRFPQNTGSLFIHMTVGKRVLSREKGSPAGVRFLKLETVVEH